MKPKTESKLYCHKCKHKNGAVCANPGLGGRQLFILAKRGEKYPTFCPLPENK